MAYDQLISWLKRARELDDAHKASLPTACPNDGTPLSTGPNGILFCKFDGWRYNGNRDTAF